MSSALGLVERARACGLKPKGPKRVALAMLYFSPVRPDPRNMTVVGPAAKEAAFNRRSSQPLPRRMDTAILGRALGADGPYPDPIFTSPLQVVIFVLCCECKLPANICQTSCNSTSCIGFVRSHVTCAHITLLPQGLPSYLCLSSSFSVPLVRRSRTVMAMEFLT